MAFRSLAACRPASLWRLFPRLRDEPQPRFRSWANLDAFIERRRASGAGDVIVNPQGFVGCYIVSFDAVNRGVTGSKMKQAARIASHVNPRAELASTCHEDLRGDRFRCHAADIRRWRRRGAGLVPFAGGRTTAGGQRRLGCPAHGERALSLAEARAHFAQCGAAHPGFFPTCARRLTEQ